MDLHVDKRQESWIQLLNGGISTSMELADLFHIDVSKIDRVISDARYDIYSKKIPSFFISHQIRIMNPLRIQMFERGSEIFNLFFFKRFRGVIIPDYKTDDLSGDLSHNLHRINEKKLHLRPD